jgi:hypothetical protein
MSLIEAMFADEEYVDFYQWLMFSKRELVHQIKCPEPVQSSGRFAWKRSCIVQMDAMANADCNPMMVTPNSDASAHHNMGSRRHRVAARGSETGRLRRRG